MPLQTIQTLMSTLTIADLQQKIIETQKITIHAQLTTIEMLERDVNRLENTLKKTSSKKVVAISKTKPCK